VTQTKQPPEIPGQFTPLLITMIIKSRDVCGWVLVVEEHLSHLTPDTETPQSRSHRMSDRVEISVLPKDIQPWQIEAEA